jgi:hypothetical protein
MNFKNLSVWGKVIVRSLAVVYFKIIHPRGLAYCKRLQDIVVSRRKLKGLRIIDFNIPIYMGVVIRIFLLAI